MMLIVLCALSMEELHLLIQKNFYRTSVTVPQQLFFRIEVAYFPLAISQLFALTLLSVASPIELQ